MKSTLLSRRQAFVAPWQEVLMPLGDVLVVSGPDAVGPDCELAVLDMDAVDREVIAQLRHSRHATKLVAAGVEFPLALELELLSLGVMGCCPAGVSAELCSRIIHSVMNGGVWLSHEAMPVVMEKLRDYALRRNPSATRASAVAPAQVLTAREFEVARLVGEGASNKVIARTLAITDRTVKAHLTTIFSKLKVHDRLQLALLMTEERGRASPEMAEMSWGGAAH